MIKQFLSKQSGTERLFKIPAGLLRTDLEYQRPLDEDRVNQYVEKWKEEAVGAVVVSRRRDGSCYIIDGQHRVRAFVKMHGENASIDCVVHDGLTLEQEADLFSTMNGKRKQTAKGDWVKSRVAAGDPTWVEILKALNRVGVEYNYYSRSTTEYRICCWAVVEKIVETGGTKLLERVLRMSGAMFGKEPFAIDGRCVRGVADFIRRYQSDSQWDEESIIEKVRHMGFPAVQAKQRSHVAAGQNPSVAWSLALRDTFNSGKRTRSLGKDSEIESVI
jgi:hypothetical protein